MIKWKINYEEMKTFMDIVKDNNINSIQEGFDYALNNIDDKTEAMRFMVLITEGRILGWFKK